MQKELADITVAVFEANRQEHEWRTFTEHPENRMRHLIVDSSGHRNDELIKHIESVNPETRDFIKFVLTQPLNAVLLFTSIYKMRERCRDRLCGLD